MALQEPTSILSRGSASKDKDSNQQHDTIPSDRFLPCSLEMRHKASACHFYWYVERLILFAIYSRESTLVIRIT